MTYKEKLKDPKWQKKRLHILDDRDWKCERCSNDEKTLHVHHRIYLKGVDPWEYEDEVFTVLCEDCHEFESLYMDNFLQTLCTVLKTKFLAADIITLCDAFQKLSVDNSGKIAKEINKKLSVGFSEKVLSK